MFKDVVSDADASPAFDPLMPDFNFLESHAEKYTREALIDELNRFDEKDVYSSDEKTLKIKKSPKMFKHTIYTLKALLELPLNRDLNGFRFVVNMLGQIHFSIEGPAGTDTPTHYQVAQVYSEINEIPESYHQSKGHLALSMGRVYLDKHHKFAGFDVNSGGFRPTEKAAVRALAIIFLCVPRKMFADELQFTVLDGGATCATHSFKKSELKDIVLAKFSRLKQLEMIQNNQLNRVIELVSSRKEDFEIKTEKNDKENFNFSNKNLFDEEENQFGQRSPMKVKRSVSFGKNLFESPVKKRETDSYESPDSPSFLSLGMSLYASPKKETGSLSSPVRTMKKGSPVLFKMSLDKQLPPSIKREKQNNLQRRPLQLLDR